MFFLNKPSQTSQFRQHAQVLSNADMAWICNHADTLHKTPGLVGQGTEKPTIRRSKIVFLPPNDQTKWLYDKVGGFINMVNAQHFNFDLTALQDLQYTEYHGEDEGTYHDHLDWSCIPYPRKLSVSIQLSDSADYEGGDLLLKNSHTPYVASRVKGDAVVFPAFLLHGVTPVTRGIRRSLVAWAIGPEFR